MGLFVEFDVVADFGYLDMTEEYFIIPDYSMGCEVFVETFMEVARKLVPIDTGYLRSTIKAETDDIYCMAEASCEYAQYPEYGTWCQEAQPYFTPALEIALKKAKPYWDMAQEEALEEEASLIEQEKEEEEGRGGGRGRNAPSSFGGIGNIGFFGGIIVSALLGILAGLGSIFYDMLFGGSSGSSSDGERSKFYDSDNKTEVFIPEVIIT